MHTNTAPDLAQQFSIATGLPYRFVTAVLREYKDRPYHNRDHLQQMFNYVAMHMKAYDLSAQEGQAAYIAVLYHDVFQGGKQPEYESWSRCWQECVEFVSPRVLNLVADAIRATQLGAGTRSNVDKIVRDADLGVLASVHEHYNRYAVAIRREYADVDPEVFREARLEVLRGFLQKPIYSELAPVNMENRARANIQWEIDQINSFDAWEA